MPLVQKHGSFRAMRILHIKCDIPEVTGPERRVLLRKRVERIRAVHTGSVRISRKATVLVRQEVVHRPMHTRTVVEMQQIAETIDHHLVARMCRMERKRLLRLIVKDPHRNLLFYKSHNSGCLQQQL